MSAPPLRRTDKPMSKERTHELRAASAAVSIAYRSVVVFGTVRMIDDAAAKAQFFDAFMAKYGKPDSGRPKHFYPRLGDVTMYAIAPERVAGKETPLPAASERWPVKDRTRSPGAAGR